MSRQGSGRAHHGYGYDPSSDGWKVDCSSGLQKSFSTYTGPKPEVRLASPTLMPTFGGSHYRYVLRLCGVVVTEHQVSWRLLLVFGGT